MRSIFIEGIPGSGKTSLLEAIAKESFGMNPAKFRPVREGELSPVELAWCAYMNEREYSGVLGEFPRLSDEIEANTSIDGGHFITAYTKIHADRVFYSYMEKYEIYGGRRSPDEFRNIVFGRFSRFKPGGEVLECSIFQNILDELLLFLLYDKPRAVEFYRQMLKAAEMRDFLLIRLIPSDIDTCVERIKRERVDSDGAEKWYDSMLGYFSGSPYGKKCAECDFSALTAYFRYRCEVENALTELFVRENVLMLESCNYRLSDVRAFIEERIR